MADLTSSAGQPETAGRSIAAEERVAEQALSDIAVVPADAVAAQPVTPPMDESARIPSPPMPGRAVYPFGLTQGDLRRLTVLALCAVLFLGFLWQVQSILPPFLIAFFLAALFDPALQKVERQGRSRVRAIAMFYLFGLCLVVLLGALIVPRMIAQVQDINQNANTYYDSIQSSINQFLAREAPLLAKFGVHQKNLHDLVSQKSGLVQTAVTAALAGVSSVLQGLASKSLWLIIIPISAFFFMRDYPLLRAKLIALFPESYQDEADTISREIVEVFSEYLRGLAKVCALYAGVIYVVYWLLGLQYALFLALLAGVFYAVPYVGQLIVATSSGLVAYQMPQHMALFVIPVKANSIAFTVTVMLCTIIAQNLFDQLVYPRVVGGSVGLHPVVSIFALMCGATMFGLWGMLLAVPVAASIQIVLTFFFPGLFRPPPKNLVETPQLAEARPPST
jgi:predicted PurR-regulated permease PerM